MKCQAVWITSWNQNCQEKYQQPQICKWYHPNGRKRRGNIEHHERGEWKSRIKTQHSENKDHGIWSPYFMVNRWGKVEIVTDFIFLGSKILGTKIADGDCRLEIQRCLFLRRKAVINLKSVLESKNITLPAKVPLDLDHKEGWAQKNWWFRIVVLEKTLESPLDSQTNEIKPVNPEGNQSWIFIGRTDAEAEVPILWPPDVENWLIGKDPDAGKDWGKQEKWVTADEMVGWHRPQWHEFGQTPGDSEGQGGPACCSPRGHKELRHGWATEQRFQLTALSCLDFFFTFFISFYLEISSSTISIFFLRHFSREIILSEFVLRSEYLFECLLISLAKSPWGV